MQRILCLILIGVLFLAACNGNATPAPTANATSANVQPTQSQSTPAPLDSTPDVAATQAALPTIELEQRVFETGQPPLPIAGTMDTVIESDPNIGLVFDSILYEQTGGIAGKPLTIEVKSDGTVTRNGVASTISPDQVTFLDNLIDQLNFFHLKGVFTAPGTSPDAYRYNLTVNRSGDSRTLIMSEGFLPPELQQFVSLISSLGAPTQ
jgi:hypothetical protein